MQPDALSVQEQLEATLAIFLQEKVHVIGSGRTDRGVHAKGQVAHFSSSKSIDERRFILSANGLLPHDIRILEIEPVPDTFHAQYSAVGKIYHYHLSLTKTHSPFTRLYTTHVRKKNRSCPFTRGYKALFGHPRLHLLCQFSKGGGSGQGCSAHSISDRTRPGRKWCENRI